jgi:hypothetical protein
MINKILHIAFLKNNKYWEEHKKVDTFTQGHSDQV